jgi:hypothetical protein
VGSGSVSSGLGGSGIGFSRPDIINKNFLVLLSPFKKKPEYYFTLNHEHFHPHYFK